jgi:hypothetical protein
MYKNDGRGRIWVKVGEYGENIMYTCMQMVKWDLLKLFQEWQGEMKENDGEEEFNYGIL